MSETAAVDKPGVPPGFVRDRPRRMYRCVQGLARPRGWGERICWPRTRPRAEVFRQCRYGATPGVVHDAPITLYPGGFIVRVSGWNASAAAVCWLVIAVLVVACGRDASRQMSGSSSSVRAPGISQPAEPAIAGPVHTPPAGRVVSVGSAPEGIVVGQAGIGAVAVRDPDGVVFFSASTGAIRQFVMTAGAARHLSLAGPDGPVLAPLEGSNELSELSLSAGTVLATAAGVGHQPHDAAMTADGTIVVTNELGGGVVFVRDSKVIGSAPAGPVQPGGVAAVGKYAVVADVRGNGAWVYDPATQRLVTHGPVGVKLTHAVGLSADLVAFADTDGGAILVERIDPQIAQVSRIEAPGSPYGLAYDARRARLYVTLTASNLMRVIDVADAAKPRVVGDVPTLEQPNSVAVDPSSGAVLIAGRGPGERGSLQIVSPDLLPSG